MPCETKTPGPMDYKMKPLVGFKDHEFNSRKARAPEWTMGGKGKSTKSAKNPGPSDVGPFNRFGKYKAIGGVISKKYDDPKLTQTPSPSAYDATPSSLYRWPYDPKFTMGVRVKSQNIISGPGPAIPASSLNHYKYRSPNYSISGKPKAFRVEKNPGPTDYVNAGEDKLKVITKSPAYSIRARLAGTKKSMNSPGPADYDLMNYNPFDRSPAHHIAGKVGKCVGVYVLPQDNC